MKLFFERIKSKLRRFIYNYELTHGKLEVKHEGIGSYKKEVRGDCLKTHSSQNVS